MSNQEASTVARAFVKVWVLRFGSPVNLHSDNEVELCPVFLRICVKSWELTGHHEQQLIILKKTQ